VITADTWLGTEGICANEAEPRPEDVTGGNALAPRSLGAIVGLGGEQPWFDHTHGCRPG
jgi:hypothetical protein